MKNRSIVQLAQELQEKYAELHSWSQVSRVCGVLTKNGRPNPGLAFRIALRSYDPARLETRLRLHLPPICMSCGQKVKRERHIPEWLKTATANLAQLETASNSTPPRRVYARGGKRIEISSLEQS